MVDFVNNVRSFVNYAIFCELCDRMRSEVDCAKSHHRVISEGLPVSITSKNPLPLTNEMSTERDRYACLGRLLSPCAYTATFPLIQDILEV